MKPTRELGKPYASVDASLMRSYGSSNDMPLWWGMAGLITIECVVFSTLIASYFYLGFRQPEWPLPGVKDPQLLLPSIGTAVLLLSSWCVHQADKAVDREDLRRMRWFLLASIVPALLFLALKVFEYSGKEFRWDSHPYGSIVWTMIGFHFAHVVSVALKTSVIVVLAWRGFFHQRNRLALAVNGFYWHFVVAIWIPLYAVIYLSPRLS